MSSLIPFFIVGCPRSGTTLLQGICMCAPHVHVASETHFFTRVPLNTQLYDPEIWSKVTQHLISVSQSEEMNTDQLEERFRQARRSPRGLYLAWLSALAAPYQAQWIGDPSNVNIKYIRELMSIFPEGKVIHILRDPRDVAYSQKSLWGVSVTRSAMQWKRAIQAHRLIQRSSFAHRYRLIRYEDLVCSPNPTIRELCNWMGWDFNSTMLTPHRRKNKGFASRESHKEGTLKPMNTSRIGRYRTRLSPDEISLVEGLCAPELQEMGTPLLEPPKSIYLPRLLIEGAQMVAEQLGVRPKNTPNQ